MDEDVVVDLEGGEVVEVEDLGIGGTVEELEEIWERCLGAIGMARCVSD